MKSLLILLLGAAVQTLVNGMPPMNQLCPVARLEHGTTYFTYDSDCEKYVQCQVDVYGQLNGTVMPCPFATFWSQESLTCEATDAIMCPNDKCLGRQNGVDRDDERNCRGYWECQNGKSVPKCCPMGQRFSVELLDCVNVGENETECNATCFGDVYDFVNETANDTQIDMNPTIVVCDLKAVPDMPNYYSQYLEGFGWILRPCAAGTVFSEMQCKCVLDNLPQVPVCKPELVLSFDSPIIRDESNKGYYVEVHNVDVQNGTGVFNGVDSRIYIPRFNNIERVSTIVIDVKYSSNASDIFDTQSILSNDVCGNMPSMRLVENSQDVVFTVGTTKMDGQVATTTVAQDLLTDQKMLRYKFSNGLLTGTLNGQSTSVLAEGYLRSVHCDLTIGAARGVPGFQGEIDELTIYMCDPDASLPMQ